MMKVRYEKGLAIHSAPSHASLPARADGVGQSHTWRRSVDRGDVGRDIEPRKQAFGMLTLLRERKAIRSAALSLAADWSRAVVDPVHASKLHARELGGLAVTRRRWLGGSHGKGQRP